jgi:hypothetical protein
MATAGLAIVGVDIVLTSFQSSPPSFPLRAGADIGAIP